MNILFLFIAIICTCFNGFSQQAKNIKHISEDIDIVKISENTYLHISYVESKKWGRISANGLIFIDGEEAYLFDTPWNNDQTKKLVAWIEDFLKAKIIGFVPSHWHSDCIGGLEYIKRIDAVSYANQLTIDIAKSKGLPTPEIGFRDSLKLELGAHEIYCFYPGIAHSIDNIVIWLPSQQILFAGCILKATNFNDLGYIEDGDLKEYPKTLKRILNKFKNATVIIPGHGNYGGIEIINHNIELAN